MGRDFVWHSGCKAFGCGMAWDGWNGSLALELEGILGHERVGEQADE